MKKIKETKPDIYISGGSVSKEPLPLIPLSRLNCHHCKLWHKENGCDGIHYNNLDKTGDTYCIQIWQNFSEESVDGKESDWLKVNK